MVVAVARKIYTSSAATRTSSLHGRPSGSSLHLLCSINVSTNSLNTVCSRNIVRYPYATMLDLSMPRLFMYSPTPSHRKAIAGHTTVTMTISFSIQSAKYTHHQRSSERATRSSDLAEGPRDALRQLKSCQLLHNCTKNRI